MQETPPYSAGTVECRREMLGRKSPRYFRSLRRRAYSRRMRELRTAGTHGASPALERVVPSSRHLRVHEGRSGVGHIGDGGTHGARFPKEHERPSVIRFVRFTSSRWRSRTHYASSPGSIVTHGKMDHPDKRFKTGLSPGPSTARPPSGLACRGDAFDVAPARPFHEHRMVLT